ncbi:MAG: hypothetical protein ACYC9W_06155 [Candidatus Limnocylindria bacterium]
MTTHVAIELAADLADVGDLLADAQAYDAAGADTLWLAPAAGLDPWPILGAIAVLTHRARLGMTVLAGDGNVGAVSRTLSRLSRGRLLLAVDGPAGALASLQRGWQGDGRPLLFTVARDPAAARAATATDGLVHRGDIESARPVIAAARDAQSGPDQLECWVRVTLPNDRADWVETCAAYEALGVTGVILPQSPRSLDLLRNPDTIDDRSDLRVAQG